MNSQLQREVGFEELCVALAKGFEDALSIQLEKGNLTKSEVALATEIERSKYSKSEWNNKR